MNIKLFVFLLVSLIISGQNSFAQAKYSKFSVDQKMKDTFSFAKQWDYSWEVFKDDSTGEFTRNNDQPLTPADTVHLFYTANCLTNVQGGYGIRYCFANKNKSIITLTFSDGLPAYASKFYFYIKGDSFCFKPKIMYPKRIAGQKVSYQVTKQKLILNNTIYKIGDQIIGYVDVEFIETLAMSKTATRQHKFFLRGYIRTPLQESTKFSN